MLAVFVLSKSGKPLDPTTRCGHVRILLKQGKARVVRTTPFTIQLLYEVEEENVTQDHILGIDPGRTNIGLCIVTSGGEPVLSAEVVTRNKEIPKLMQKRKQFRQAHRKLKRRDKRRRRARAAGTIKASEFQRLLPGYEKPIVCKDIKNKEARSNNRVRPEGWLAPTANQLLLTHINVVKKLQKLVPISKIVLEVNRFAFMALDNPDIQKWQFQKGPLYGKGSVEQAVYELQDGKCLLCGGKIEHYHHIKGRGPGSETLANRVGLCEYCHHLVHTDETVKAKLEKLKFGQNKKYGALSVLNQIIPKLTEELSSLASVFVTTGYDTKQFRDKFSIEKTHSNDAYCIACSVNCVRQYDNLLPSILNMSKTIVPTEKPHLIRQFRRHDRQACIRAMTNRKYYLDNKLVATNRKKPKEQFTDSLEEFRAVHSETEVSRLTVKKHPAQYKDMDRLMPGAIISNNGHRFVLNANAGTYFIGTNGIRYLAKNCKIIRCNEGLVWIS